MPRPLPQARPAGPTEARAYLAKAHEFLHAASDSLELTNHTAAVGNAVHAGIAAGDALSAVRTGTVWRGEQQPDLPGRHGLRDEELLRSQAGVLEAGVTPRGISVPPAPGGGQ